jgi:hypothetical protein
MRHYCKAYYLKDLRQFKGWHEKREDNEAVLPDDAVCYLWDDFTVVSSPVQDKGNIFDTITPEWQDFCRHTLQFAIPEDLRYAYQQTNEQAAV